MLPKFLKKIKPKDTPRTVGSKLRPLLGGGIIKKAVIVLLLLVLLFPLFAQPAQAFFTPNATYLVQFENAVFHTDEMNLQSFVYETFKATLASGYTLIFPCLTCAPGEKHYGALLNVSNLIAMIYDSPPASGVEYLAYLGRKLDLVPETYAQTAGEGFSRLDILLPIWQAFRNIAYVFFVLILVFIGFAIMFRVKISPQAVISIQSALPRIILGLVLITFSYAIVGLLIDLMLVVSNLIITVFNNIGNIDALLGGILADPPVTHALLLGGTMLIVGFIPILSAFILLVIATGAVSVLGGLIGTVATGGGGPLGATVGLAAGIIVMVIVAIIFLIALFKLLWTLLKAYINVILALIFGPFQILIGTIPGSPATGSWFKNLLANLAVFPTVLTMVFLAGYLCIKAIALIGTDLLITIISLFRIGTNPTDVIRILTEALRVADKVSELGTMTILFFVSLGLLLMAPKVADMIKAFMSGQPFGYGAAIGETFGPAATVAGVPLGYGKWEAGKGLEKFGTGQRGPEWLRGIARGAAGYTRDKGWFK